MTLPDAVRRMIEMRALFWEDGRSWKRASDLTGASAQALSQRWMTYQRRYDLAEPHADTQPLRETAFPFDETITISATMEDDGESHSRYDIDDPIYDLPDDTHHWIDALEDYPDPLRLAFPTDIHIGKVDGKLTHDPRALDLMLKIVSDFKPHVVVVGSDLHEFDSISRWGSHFDRMAADALKEVEKPTLNLFSDLRSAAPDADLPFLVGNHDWRIEENSRRSQYRHTLISDYVDMLRAGGAWWMGFGNTAMDIRSLFLLHGQFTPKYAANKHGDFYAWHKDIMFGHTHRFDYSFRQNRVSWGIGSLASMWAHYSKHKTGWQQGFALATIYHGHTQVTPLIFNDYRTVWGNKEYRA